MTIRFIKSWNGYYDGQIVTSPAGGNSEAALIAMGYATADLDGPNNSPVAVMATTDLTGGGVNIVLSNTAAVDADGRPDGTIYVQTV